MAALTDVAADNERTTLAAGGSSAEMLGTSAFGTAAAGATESFADFEPSRLRLLTAGFTAFPTSSKTNAPSA
jgi:hypothetical protein